MFRSRKSMPSLMSRILVACWALVLVTSAAGLFASPFHLDWARGAGGLQMDDVVSVSSASDGSVYISGVYQESTTLGKGEAGEVTLPFFPSSAGFANFVAKYRPDGRLAWARQAGGGELLFSSPCIVALPNGGAVLAGHFSGSVTLGAGETKQVSFATGNESECDILLVCYQADGRLAWARQVGGQSWDAANGIDRLADGDLVVTGLTGYGSVFGAGETSETQMTSDGTFIARYGQDGTLKWARLDGIRQGPGMTQVEAIAGLADGGFAIAGGFTNKTLFGQGDTTQTVLTANGETSAFVVRYNADGHMLWARKGGGESFDRAYGIAGGTDNTVAIVGSFDEMATFDAGDSQTATLISAGGADGFVAAYRSDGRLDWARQYGSEGSEDLRDIKILPSREIIVSGSGPGQFLTGLGAEGQQLWKKDVSADNTAVHAIDFTPTGGLVVAGYFSDSLSLGVGDKNQTTLTGAGGMDVYVARYAVNPVEIISPNGGERYTGGTFLPIYWHTDPSTAGTGVRFELWNKDGKVADLGNGWNQEGHGYKKALLPMAAAGTDYRVRVISTWDSSMWDESAQPFTLSGGPICVRKPLNGEVWIEGSSQWIWWDSTLDVTGSAVRMELWRSGKKIANLGTDWNAEGHGSFKFTVPHVPAGSDYKLHVISNWDPSRYAENEGAIIIRSTLQSSVPTAAWVLYE